jgi:methionyl-tRNA formyltransferase
VGVVTLAKEHAKFHSDYADLSDVASQHGIPVYKIKNINDPENVRLVRSLRPDVIFVFGWSQLVSKQILTIPSLGAIGAHPALLPRNRGRHPIIWALVEGLKESGLTFFYMDEGADSGAILWQRPLPIMLEDDAGSLYEKICMLASDAIREFLPWLQQGTAPRLIQDHTRSTYWRKRTEKDGEIHWKETTMRIYNLIRALARPYVGAHTWFNSDKMVIWRAKLSEEALSDDALSLAPGSIFKEFDNQFHVRSGDGYLIILEFESVKENTIKVGDRLGVRCESLCNLGSSR